jgi:hypothetical protein
VTFASATLEQRHDVQFGGGVVVWVEYESLWADASRVEQALSESGSEEQGVLGLYARLADAYQAETVLPDRGGGVRGDLYPLDR